MIFSYRKNNKKTFDFPNENYHHEYMKKIKGRPIKMVNWPEGVFSSKQARIYNEGKVSVGLVHSKIKKGLECGELQKSGETKADKGRPTLLYSKPL